MTRLMAAGIVVLAGLAPAGAAKIAEAPDVVLRHLDGKPAKIDYKSHRLTLVNFWATWCLPCHEEMPQIAKLVREHSSQGFQAVGIAVESGEAADVKRFLDDNSEFGINYPILMGTLETLESFGDVQILPTTYLVDSKGRIVETFMGVQEDFFEFTDHNVREYLKEVARREAAGQQPASGDSKPEAGKPKP